MAAAFTAVAPGMVNQLRIQATIEGLNHTVTAEALWDTGATNSCISKEVVEALHLVPTGMTRILTPSGEDTVSTYLVDVMLPNNVRVTDLRVNESAIGAQGIGILIGMDIISLGDFAVSNFKGKTAFSFRIPSEKRTDYVVEENIKQKMGPKHGPGKRKKH